MKNLGLTAYLMGIFRMKQRKKSMKMIWVYVIVASVVIMALAMTSWLAEFFKLMFGGYGKEAVCRESEEGKGDV